MEEKHISTITLGKATMLSFSVVAAAVVFAACSPKMEKPVERTEAVQSPAVSAPAAGEAMTDSDVKIVEVEAGSFYYKPNEIRVKKGQKVKIMMKSVSMMHDLKIDELGVAVPVTKSGDVGTAEFVADKVGTFEMYCSVGQHRANGQVGKLIVEE